LAPLNQAITIRVCDTTGPMLNFRKNTDLPRLHGMTTVISALWKERQQHDWNEIKDILIHTTAKSHKPFAVVYQDSIIQVDWNLYTSDHHSIIVQ
jgi:hypothetical protein